MGHAHAARKARTTRTALYKDAWRAIAGNGKRFAAIAVICAVGVMMMGALSSISNDLRAGMDEFLDTTSMHDLSIVSTLGFDDDDITALRGVDGVSEAVGVRSSSAYTKIDDKQASATVTALNDRHIDEPYLTEGRLPKAAHEIAVTSQYLTDSGKRIGDTLTFTVDESSSSAGTFEDGDYTIVGTVIDPNDIVNPTGPLALVTATKTVYPLFVAPQAVADDDAPYTSAAIRVDGADAMNTYDDAYLDRVSDVQSNIEKIRPEPPATWIIRDRSVLTSWADVKTESEMIGRLGKLFPILFLVIAILVSLTAVARMVEEDRQLIGTYKALGYTRHETMLKYLIYSAAAVLVGGVIGDLIGLLGLPLVFTKRMLHLLYVIPTYPLLIDWMIGLGGIALFLVLITGSAMAVCAGSLRLNPAELLRPKAPTAG